MLSVPLVNPAVLVNVIRGVKGAYVFRVAVFAVGIISVIVAIVIRRNIVMCARHKSSKRTLQARCGKS